MAEDLEEVALTIVCIMSEVTEKTMMGGKPWEEKGGAMRTFSHISSSLKILSYQSLGSHVSRSN